MKKSLSNSVRLRFAAVLLFLLPALGSAFAQVSVSNMATDYPAKKVSFTVTWTAQPHHDQIWMIVDYVKIAGATTVGNWSRANVTGVDANGYAAASTVTGHRGFWLFTNEYSSGSANVTATLDLAGVDKFNWCAYALNMPPQAVLQPDGSYKLQGTPPFTVNGTKLGNNVTTFGPGTCITSLSDATDNPEKVLPALPEVSSSNPAARCGAGEVTLTASASGGTTTAMTYTWDVGGGIGTHNSSIGSQSLASVAVGSTTYSVTVTNAFGCTSAAATGAITIHGLPDITLTSANSSQTVTEGTAITDIEYTTTNASGATATGLPDDVSGSWSTSVYIISGTPSATGTFNYTVVTKNSNGCSNATATGTLTVNASCANCIIWLECTSVTAAMDDYNGVSQSGFTEITNLPYETEKLLNWEDANTFCSNKSPGWRLPTVQE
ncbi:MAG: hypothetical protein LBF81_04565 [Prevotellaceae bacterium]|jgi:hypothetical protein|nr:hypothetical protein [Prevotellaceae bacterium]